MSAVSFRDPPVVESHRNMCDSFDAHVKNRADIDAMIAATWQSIARSLGLSNSLGVVASKSVDVVHDCRMREEVVLLQAQIAKLEEMGASKDRKLKQLERELAQSEGGGDASLLSARRSDPVMLQRLFDDVLEKEDAIRHLEHRILHANGLLADLARQFHQESDSADALQRKSTVLDAKLDVVQQEINGLHVAIGRTEQHLRDAAMRGHMSTARLQQHQQEQHPSLEEEGEGSTTELAQTRRAMLADIERLEREVEALRKGGGDEAAAGDRRRSPLPRTASSPSPQRMLPRDAGYGFGGRLCAYQQVSETLAQLKAFLVNLNTDLPLVSEVVDSVAGEPNHDSPEWRRDKLSACFLDVVSLMEQPYRENVQLAEELIRSMKVLVVVWDLFEASLEEDIDAILERVTIRDEARHMFGAALTCVDVVTAAASKLRGGQGKRKSISKRIKTTPKGS